ncbi:hypothetical protein [Herminiimonas contaminans]|uniref:Uncharacterized protein n=1 Tax=Herminiimonas contaminans TaxID=1111140 RepID=A0ABS0EXQ8_9BURK|nr:hypothetical protein [Herminiimonas contaminans]MBF8179636.1 hypothetical protein [Herminiimonas contaminans]
MDKITKSLLETFSAQNDIEKKDEANQFEHFANFSIISKLNRSSFELDDVHMSIRMDIATHSHPKVATCSHFKVATHSHSKVATPA